MPLLTLKDDEKRDLADLLTTLYEVCAGNVSQEPVNWPYLAGRIQDMRLKLFEKE